MPDQQSPTGRYPQAPCVAVGAIVFKEDHVLLVRRGKAPSRGQWAIPGGSVTLGESLQEAAERAIFEETGIRITAGKPAYVFDVVDRQTKRPDTYTSIEIHADVHYFMYSFCTLRDLHAKR